MIAMNNFYSLKILDGFSFMFKKSKVDYQIMRQILALKLTQDNRRETILTKSQGLDENETNFFLSYWLYILMGFFMIPLAFISDSPFIGLSLFFGIILFLLISTMLSDFSSVILDTRDKSILLTKPINKETVTLARFIHIFIYLMRLMIMITVPGLISFSINYSVLFGGVLLLTMVLLCFLSILGTSFIYTFLMKYFEGEKLKDVINIFQIFFMIIMNVGYHVMIRMFDFIDFALVFKPKWWSYLLPPAWFAAVFEVLFYGQRGIEYFILSALGIIVPIISMVIHIKIIAPQFETYLSKLDRMDQVTASKKGYLYKLREKFNDFIAKGHIERTFISFTRVMLKKERSIKFKIYPLLALAFALPLVLIGMNILDQVDVSFLEALGDDKTVLYFYLSSFMLGELPTMLQFSDQYKGAWIYGVAPIEDREQILKGAMKGLLSTYIVPIWTVLLTMGVFIYGLKGLLHFTVIFSAGYIALLLSYKFSEKNLPFSIKHSNEIQKKGSFKRILIFLLVIGGSYFIHLKIYSTTLALSGFALVLVILDYMLWPLAFKEKTVKEAVSE